MLYLRHSRVLPFCEHLPQPAVAAIVSAAGCRSPRERGLAFALVVMVVVPAHDKKPF